MSDNYWITEYMSVLTNGKDTWDGPTVQFLDNNKVSTTRTWRISLERSLSAHAKKVHIFDGLHSDLLISLGQLCDYDCIAILDNN